jgi:hypothetical protein
MNKILEVFETSGKEVFTSKNKRNIFKQDSKPWYTNKCYNVSIIKMIFVEIYKMIK